jgi:hypothetical protein
LTPQPVYPSILTGLGCEDLPADWKECRTEADTGKPPRLASSAISIKLDFVLAAGPIITVSFIPPAHCLHLLASIVATSAQPGLVYVDLAAIRGISKGNRCLGNPRSPPRCCSPVLNKPCESGHGSKGSPRSLVSALDVQFVNMFRRSSTINLRICDSLSQLPAFHDRPWMYLSTITSWRSCEARLSCNCKCGDTVFGSSWCSSGPRVSAVVQTGLGHKGWQIRTCA